MQRVASDPYPTAIQTRLRKEAIMNTTAILSIITMLLTGTNIVTLVQLRSLRRKGSYEADAVRINNLQTIIDLQGKEIERLNTRQIENEQRCDEKCQHYEQKIEELQNKYDSLVSAMRSAGMKIAI